MTLTWEQALTTLLDGKDCLWQDLDGLHIEPAPAHAPPTSILWAWSTGAAPAQTEMVRLRLDPGQDGVTRVYAATATGGPGTALAAYKDDGRTAAYRPASAGAATLQALGVVAVTEQVAPGRTPVMFIRRDA